MLSLKKLAYKEKMRQQLQKELMANEKIKVCMKILQQRRMERQIQLWCHCLAKYPLIPFSWH